MNKFYYGARVQTKDGQLGNIASVVLCGKVTIRLERPNWPFPCVAEYSIGDITLIEQPEEEGLF